MLSNEWSHVAPGDSLLKPMIEGLHYNIVEELDTEEEEVDIDEKDRDENTVIRQLAFTPSEDTLPPPPRPSSTPPRAKASRPRVTLMSDSDSDEEYEELSLSKSSKSNQPTGRFNTTHR